MAYNYPYGNGQQLNLDWFLNEWKNLLAAWEAEKNGIEGALQAEIDRAEAALADVFAARDAAAQSAANALESKNAAAQSASDASGYLTTVRADANTASNAAQNAAQSESNAAESAQTALASKNTAANSERNAAQSEANANSSKNAAAQSAEDASASKDAAAQSAADALANKNAAAQSAEDAEDAASSVEESAEQIKTNKNDIVSLNKLVNVLTPDIYISKNAYIQNGSMTNDRRKITIENGVIEYEVIGAVTRGFLITGENITDLTGSITTFPVTENMLNPINKLCGCNTLKVLAESDVIDPESPAIRNIFAIYFYHVENGVCTRLSGSVSVSNLTGYYINYFEIPENATHYAISVFSGNGNAVKSTFHVEFTKTDLSALAIALSN